jgi:NAD(P)-dependent dehydrogenase (short-subunit alcohol dehydrogenase family)
MAFSADTLLDKVAIVTGASQGIGHAIAIALSRVGADVVLCSRRRAVLEEVASAVRANGRQALACACDVSDPEQIERLTGEARARFGRIDILVNNAAYRSRGPLETLSSSEWEKMLRVNLSAVVLLSQAVGRHMIARQSGRIINITSVAGRSGSPGMTAYAATKAAVTVFTQSLAAEWAKHKVNVNAIAPGPVETEGAIEVWRTPEMIARVAQEVPLKRLGRPEEIADAAIFLASDHASFITGETLYVSGGPKTGSRED